MRKLIWILGATVVVAVAAAGVWKYLQREPAEWTTTSPRAFEEFREGLDDLARIYRFDARAHFERALELDPDFAAAKLFLAMLKPGESEHERLLAELRETDLDRLRPRERFLIRYDLAYYGGQDQEMDEILRAFLDQHPEDPYGLKIECDRFWGRQEWDAAESCYQRLLKLHPNRVEAQNRLGYIAMARGRFSDAEERFLTYRYVAPDQANPYHSMAELLIVLGRYEEAEKALQETVRIKDDFCPAYLDRARLCMYMGRFDDAREHLREVEEIPVCEYLASEGVLCAIRAWMTYLEGRTDEAWEEVAGDCLERNGGFETLAHRIAAMTGRDQAATAMETSLRQRYEKLVAEEQPIYAENTRAVLAHAEGVRRLAAGDLEGAAERFREADRRLGYWIPGIATLKMWNRVNLLATLEALGEDAEATAMRRKIEAVNPRWLDEIEVHDLEGLGER